MFFGLPINVRYVCALVFLYLVVNLFCSKGDDDDDDDDDEDAATPPTEVSGTISGKPQSSTKPPPSGLFYLTRKYLKKHN